MTTGALSILAVDDERPALADVARLLRDSPAVNEVVCAQSGGEALRLLTERQFDALFVDVRMPGLSGLDLAAILGRFASPPGVVFVSAYEDGAVRAFEVHALDYLMKPVGRHRIEAAIMRVAEFAGSRDASDPPVPSAAPTRSEDGHATDEFVAVERASGAGTRIVARSSILYVMARGDYVRLISEAGRFTQRGTLAEIEQRWAPYGFHRVHRAYLVNLRHAVEVRPDHGGAATILLGDGSVIPVSRRQVGDLRRRLRM